ncbi:hypothetical protein CAAN1_15S01794 [[Candida] anglica]|uniref:Uncharacterized protein n=1 Tax=[Candida] anglica TaxID=148631 RepID=A0ABP0E873_9ASCO
MDVPYPDLSFVDINSLAYSFEDISIHKVDNDKQKVIDTIVLPVLELMDQYKCLHPSYKDMLSYLGNHSKFNENWAQSINSHSLNVINETTTKLTEYSLQEPESSYGENSSRGHDLIDPVKRVIIIYLVTGNYASATSLLAQFSSNVQFYSQPITIEEFVSNRFMEFLLYSTMVNVETSWFSPTSSAAENASTFQISKTTGNGPKSATNSSVGASNSSIANANNKRGSIGSGNASTSKKDSIFKKATLYYTKNKHHFNSGQSQSNYELACYWLICWLRLTDLFRKCEFTEFYQEFISLISIVPVRSTNSPLDVITDPAYSNLKSSLVIMFGICSSLTLPFNQLSFLNHGELESTKITIIDLFTLGPESNKSMINSNLLLSHFYNVLVALSETKFEKAKSLLDPTFTQKLQSCLGYIMPRRKSGTVSFLDFFIQTIDFKVFLMIMSNMKRIPRVRLLQFLGYSETRTDILEKLLQFMSAMNLGELGFGFDTVGDYFYKYDNPDRHVISARHEVEDLQQSLEGDSLGELVRGLLIERFFAVG